MLTITDFRLDLRWKKLSCGAGCTASSLEGGIGEQLSLALANEEQQGVGGMGGVARPSPLGNGFALFHGPQCLISPHVKLLDARFLQKGYYFRRSMDH